MRNITKLQEIAVFQNEFGTFYNDVVVNSLGAVGHYLRWKWVHQGVVAIPYRDGLLALAKMFRYPIGDFSLEFPRGAIEDDETEITAAIRELKEESGLSCVDVQRIGEIYPESGLLAQPISVVIAQVTGQQSTREEVMEVVDSVEWFTPLEINNLINKGNVKCSVTISAFTLFQLNKLRLSET